MREIKFRAWSNKYQHMFRVREITQDRNGYTHGTIDEEFENEFEPEFDTPFVWVGRVGFAKIPDGRTAGLFQDPNDEPFYLMQYTGLKDKNDKKIYEGDILRFDEGKAPKEILMVKYSGAGFALVDPKFKGNLYAEVIPNYVDVIGEVVGNIFENPEYAEAMN
ncbi:YopX family protein [Bacillus sonorensis]|uniref:YopX family protein n=1 Tax=Bacillus sonorensis TaxID=119858 RepID=UPI001F21790A|nr:YopX family protein [Bacillus sonorensis]MCF7617381.1 YopX family protein [Bacillus sonorensis]